MTRLTAAQAAERLGVTDRTVLNYINRGLLPATKESMGLDWRYVIELDDLEAFAAKQNIPLQRTDSDSA